MTDDLISRKAAIAEIDCGGCYGRCNDPANCRMEDVKAIRAIPLPDHADLLAAALALPEVAAIVQAASLAWQGLVGEYGYQKARVNFGSLEDALSALEARHD